VVTVVVSSRYDSALHCVDVCSHPLFPQTFERIAEEFKDSKSVLIARVNGDEHGDLARKFNVVGFPTFYWFAPGSLVAAESYTAARTESDVISFIRTRTGADCVFGVASC
jgi:protein disulfide-isomerase A6